MKNIAQGIRLAASCAALGLSVYVPLAQADQFIRGNYVEAGIHSAGSFGSGACAPPTFHPSRVTCRLGFIADVQKDGWGAGTPGYGGDYFLPGSPYEGWVVEWNGAGGVERRFENAGAIGIVQIPKVSESLLSSGSAEWNGEKLVGSERLSIRQQVSIPADKGFMLVEVRLTNSGTVPLASVEYLRGVDPDQGITIGGGFETLNWVEYQPPRTAGSRPALAARPAGNTDKALAFARETGYGITLGLGTVDLRAVAASGSYWPTGGNNDPDGILNSPSQPSPSSPWYGDDAMALAFDVGDLDPGESSTIKFAYVLSPDDLDAAFATLAPKLAGLTDLTLEATSAAGAVASYTVTADDPEDGAIAAICSPASGSTFALGSTTVSCEATDSDGNATSGSLTVTVVDTTAPSLTLPTGFVEEATGPAGAAVSFSATAHDTVSGSFDATCAPASGSTFALGTTVVACTATDGHGNAASGVFTVTVTDTTAPSLACPADVVGVPGEDVDLGDAVVSDLADPSPTVENDAPMSYSPGATTVTWTATDDAGNQSTCAQTVTLRYTFDGFFPPVDNLPAYNVVKNGATVPVKWRLLDANGTHITDTATVQRIGFVGIACGGTEDAIEELASATGGTSLRWDETSMQFIYNWTTPARRGKCVRLDVSFTDGTTRSANFRLK